jgi:hypothetical protein
VLGFTPQVSFIYSFKKKKEEKWREVALYSIRIFPAML